VAIALDLAEGILDPSEATSAPRPRIRTWWAVTGAALSVIGLLLAFVVWNETEANTKFDQADHALRQTDAHIDATVATLTAVRHDLRFLETQIDASQKSLSSDATLLQGIRSALAQAQQDVSEKSSYIVNLKTCQTGVEQALNALSVGDEPHAVAALGNVSAACQKAAALSG
jgi:septal ring factor EnvC (AmiA/AmiB activator)